MKKGWNTSSFGDLISPANVERCGNRTDLPILSITMRNGIIFQADRFKKVIASTNTEDYKVVKNGQLVIAFPIDEGLIYTQDIAEEGIMSPAYNIWNVDYTRIDRKFLVYYFHSPFAMQYYKSKLRGTTQRRRMLPKEDLLALPIPIPTLNEQKHIVEEIELLNSIIEKKKNQLNELDNLSFSYYFEMFGEVADYTAISNHVDSLGGGKSLAGNEECENKVLKTGAVTYDYFDGTAVKNLPIDFIPSQEHLLKDGDILVSRMNTLEYVGACAYVWKAPKNTYLPDRLWRIKLKEGINPIYFWFSIIQSEAKEQIRSLASGTSGTMKNISRPRFLTVKIKNVPLDLQNQFAERVQAIEHQKELIKKSIKEVETLFNSRMDYYFN